MDKHRPATTTNSLDVAVVRYALATTERAPNQYHRRNQQHADDCPVAVAGAVRLPILPLRKNSP
jgi:hypothetical protein